MQRLAKERDYVLGPENHIILLRFERIDIPPSIMSNDRPTSLIVQVSTNKIYDTSLALYNN